MDLMGLCPYGPVIFKKHDSSETEPWGHMTAAKPPTLPAQLWSPKATLLCQSRALS